MRVEFKNGDIKTILDITFCRTAVGKRRKVKGKELIDTCCKISINPCRKVSRILNASTSEESVLITKTIARQNPLDKYNKIIGRKVALAKAIANMSFLTPLSYVDKNFDTNLERLAIRKHIWNVFYQTHGAWN